jgi:hypothetical protein
VDNSVTRRRARSSLEAVGSVGRLRNAAVVGRPSPWPLRTGSRKACSYQRHCLSRLLLLQVGRWVSILQRLAISMIENLSPWMLVTCSVGTEIRKQTSRGAAVIQLNRYNHVESFIMAVRPMVQQVLTAAGRHVQCVIALTAPDSGLRAGRLYVGLSKGVPVLVYC